MATVAEENGFHETQFQTNDSSVVRSANEGSKQVQPPEEPMQLDIVINNVVCSFSVRCHLNLRQIALQASNVEYRRENGMVTMKMRKPYTTASMWSSGKITCTGATSEDLAKVAARRFARLLQNLGFRVHFSNYRVVNVLGTCTMPFSIRIVQFSRDNRENASYEPELHPGVTYKLKEPKATLKIFSTGSVTVTAPSVHNVQAAIEHIFPLVYQYRNTSTIEKDNALSTVPHFYSKGRKKGSNLKRYNHIEIEAEEYDLSEEEEDEFMDSDESWD